jgi:putative FmdB family regulatory protein
MSPIYVFECRACERRVEEIFKLSEEAKLDCAECGTQMEKVIGTSSFVVKGYNAQNNYGSTDRSRRK